MNNIKLNALSHTKTHAHHQQLQAASTVASKQDTSYQRQIPLSLSSLSIETCASSTNSDTTPASTSTSYSKSYNKFFNTFKSLFDIFDPERKGYIDLYELESLGANQNEILSDIIGYLKEQHETKASHNGSTGSRAFYVTFDTFVNSADIILKKRKQAKSSLKEIRKHKTLSDAFTFDSNTTAGSQQPRRTSTDGRPPHAPPTQSHSMNNIEQQQHGNVESGGLKNANSFDLSILMEQEFNLLKTGLLELDKTKRIFELKLNGIKQKQHDLSKLKYQNLLSIDKMLMNLNEIVEFNKTLCAFNEQNMSTLLQDNGPLLANDYFVTGGNDADLIKRFDLFISEKQKRINYLNEEKSKLIRRLFELKSNDSTQVKNDIEEMFFANNSNNNNDDE
jgi:hypothetical protein